MAENSQIKKRAVVFLADGFEEVEAVTPVDYLCRAGIDVTTVSISDSARVTGRWGGIKLTADTTLAEFIRQDVKNFDAAIIPGGMPGAANIAASENACKLLKEMSAAGKLICAICASPVIVLAPLGILAGKNFTCYPGMEEKIPDYSNGLSGKWSDSRVVTDGNLITSRGAGTAGEFSIAIIEKLINKETAVKTAQTVLI
ncbi:MAG: DJ-1/PfpI family protein [Treponema sp.]|nr:DJ-1/PfpI family protein [Treponema sp.]